MANDADEDDQPALESLAALLAAERKKTIEECANVCIARDLNMYTLDCSERIRALLATEGK